VDFDRVLKTVSCAFIMSNSHFISPLPRGEGTASRNKEEKFLPEKVHHLLHTLDVVAHGGAGG